MLMQICNYIRSKFPIYALTLMYGAEIRTQSKKDKHSHKVNIHFPLN
jgi:hypothetical protein